MTAVLAGRVPSEPVSITTGVAAGDELAVGLGLGDELAVEVELGAGVAAPAAGAHCAEVPSRSADATATPASCLPLPARRAEGRVKLVLTFFLSWGS
jgi:hypothetical protein